MEVHWIIVLDNVFLFPSLLFILISNSNCTEWSTIQRVIARVISKSVEREARGRFEITSKISPNFRLFLHKVEAKQESEK